MAFAGVLGVLALSAAAVLVASGGSARLERSRAARPAKKSTAKSPGVKAPRPLPYEIRGVWHNRAGLGWANPYSRGSWRYAVDVGAAAARAGFDEIQFDGFMLWNAEGVYTLDVLRAS